MNKKIFVTGAAGFVGRHLVPFLIKENYKVTFLIRNIKEKDRIPTSAQIVIGDLSKKGIWMSQLKDHHILIHLAAIVSAKNTGAFKRNNVIATQNLISAAKKAKVKKIILFSSAAVTSIRKDDYASTKEKQEEIVKNSKIKYEILRPSMIYGPEDNKNIGWLINFIKKFPVIPLPGGGNFGRQPVYVKDICRIVLKLLKKDYPKRIYEIHGYEYVTLKRMINSIIRTLHAKRVIINVPISFLLIATAVAEKISPNPKFTVDQIRSLTSGEKFKGDLWWETFGIIPTSFEAGIAQMIKEK